MTSKVRAPEHLCVAGVATFAQQLASAKVALADVPDEHERLVESLEVALRAAFDEVYDAGFEDGRHYEGCRRTA